MSFVKIDDGRVQNKVTVSRGGSKLVQRVPALALAMLTSAKDGKMADVSKDTAGHGACGWGGGGGMPSPWQLQQQQAQAQAQMYGGGQQYRAGNFPQAAVPIQPNPVPVQQTQMPPDGGGYPAPYPRNPQGPVSWDRGGRCIIAPELQKMGCVADGCGNVYAYVRGQYVRIERPETISCRPLSASVGFQSFVTGDPRTFTLTLAPDVQRFIPRKLILATGAEGAVTNFNLEKVLIDSLKIGPNDMIVGKSQFGLSGSIVAEDAVAAASIGGRTFAENAEDNLFDFDPLVPQLGLQVSGLILPQSTADLGCILTFTLFGFSFSG